MAGGLQRLVRRDILTRLKQDAFVTALVPSTSIYSQATPKEPKWPFIKTGAVQSIPIRGACMDGATVNISVHGFSRGRYNASGALVETAEDHASRIGAAIEDCLDAKGATLTTGERVRYRLTDVQLLVDGGEPDAFHYFANVSARVL